MPYMRIEILSDLTVSILDDLKAGLASDIGSSMASRLSKSARDDGPARNKTSAVFECRQGISTNCAMRAIEDR
jgi:hypothetical protein